MTSDHYLNSMIIEALLENGMRNINEINIITQQHLQTIRRIFDESGLDNVELNDSLYEQLQGMVSDYFSQVLPHIQNTPNQH